MVPNLQEARDLLKKYNSGEFHLLHDNLIFTAFGAGFTYGAVYVKWGYDGSKR